jgi:RNA polymerase sigma-70 factor (ECF subfamily)
VNPDSATISAQVLASTLKEEDRPIFIKSCPSYYIMTLEEIAEEHGEFVSALCMRMISDEDAAKDAAQQAWIEIVKSYPSFKGDAKITTWMYTIVRRVVIDYAARERTYSTRHLRDYFREEKAPEPAYTEGMDKDLWVRQMCDRCLTGILHCLEAESRMAYVFKDIAGLQYSEMVTVFEKNEAALRKAVTRSRNKLKAFLNNECYLYNPNGTCKCRMKRYVKDVNLRQEYDTLKKASNLARFYRQSGTLRPRKNFWKKISG